MIARLMTHLLLVVVAVEVIVVKWLELVLSIVDALVLYWHICRICKLETL